MSEDLKTTTDSICTNLDALIEMEKKMVFSLSQDLYLMKLNSDQMMRDLKVIRRITC